MEWETKQEKIKELADQGKLAVGMDVENPEHVRITIGSDGIADHG